MTHRHIIPFGIAVCMSYLCSCATESVQQSDLASTFRHPLASAGVSNVFVDDRPTIFPDNFDYVEYYEGEPMTDEFSYYVDRGYHSVLNVDLNADTAYISFMILDAMPKLGSYRVLDTALAGIASMSYRLNGEMTNIQKQVIESGTLQITKLDSVHARLSGVYAVTVRSKATAERHTIEGSFTDLYLKFGEDGGEVMRADISGAGWRSGFDSNTFHHAFGNSHGQGVDEEYFSLQMSTPEDTSTGYESLFLLLAKPMHAGTFDLEPGRVRYSKYDYDHMAHQYRVSLSDTNAASIANAVTITEMDTVRRRISGRFGFTMEDASARSPIRVRGGEFRNLYWW